MKLWLSLDPETFRVSAQEEEFLDGSFPKGLRGTGWKTAQTEVDKEIWTKMLRGELSVDEQDECHRKWWSEAYGKTWPEI